MGGLLQDLKKVANVIGKTTVDVVHDVVGGVTKLTDLFSKKKKSSVPSPAPPGSPTALKLGCEKAVQSAFIERVSSEMSFNQTQTATPLPSKTLCDSIAEEYDNYFKTLHAGIMSPNPTTLTVLKSSLATYNFVSWGAAFSAYWLATTWLPSGVFTGGIVTNAPVCGTGLQTEITALISPPGQTSTMIDFADRIATILATYTTKLTVQATLSIPPNTTVVTVA